MYPKQMLLQTKEDHILQQQLMKSQRSNMWKTASVQHYRLALILSGQGQLFHTQRPLDFFISLFIRKSFCLVNICFDFDRSGRQWKILRNPCGAPYEPACFCTNRYADESMKFGEFKNSGRGVKLLSFTLSDK